MYYLVGAEGAGIRVRGGPNSIVKVYISKKEK